MMSIPRPEHPRPQLYRQHWQSLNGKWTFCFDFGRSGFERGFAKSKGFDQEIVVPFCPESRLSGIHHTDFLESIWYQRDIQINQSWSGKSILLHFGAVDYEAIVYIDGKRIGIHYGGSSSFSFDITEKVKDGLPHSLVVHVKDEIRGSNQGGGKQSLDYYSVGCFYTRVTGIWQSVWMEAVVPGSVIHYQALSDIDNNFFHLRPQFFGHLNGSFKLSILRQSEVIAEQEYQITPALAAAIRLPDKIDLWSPENPNLYDLKIETVALDGSKVDEIASYTGFRKIHIENSRIFLNNEPIYLRFVLDQGYYQEGIWTASSDQDLKNDILISKAAGFNGARLHQKIFEERFHYWADVLGYLTWAEFPSWGLSMKHDLAARNFISEWREIVIRDRNHPSIIAWTPLNETWDNSDLAKHRRLHYEAYDLTKSLDPTRPVNGASGGCQVVTDLYSVHNYEQDAPTLKEMLTPTLEGEVYATLGAREVPYSGQPYFVDEFGGIKWIASDRSPFAINSWGYGTAPLTDQEFIERLKSQVQALLELKHLSGYCYTQLTDVEQEQNGIYNYDRSEKFNIEIIKEIFSQTPSDITLPEDLKS